jgi:hypothetical protein
MCFEPTTTSAIEYSKNNKLEEWIHLFLCRNEKNGGNEAFSKGLKLEPRKYYSPCLMNLNKFQRCCGPEEDMKYRVPASDFNKKIKGIIENFQKNIYDMPPLIINRNADKYELSDGNHRFEALKKLGIKEFWVIIWETNK